MNRLFDKLSGNTCHTAFMIYLLLRQSCDHCELPFCTTVALTSLYPARRGALLPLLTPASPRSTTLDGADASSLEGSLEAGQPERTAMECQSLVKVKVDRLSMARCGKESAKKMCQHTITLRHQTREHQRAARHLTSTNHQNSAFLSTLAAIHQSCLESVIPQDRQT